MRIGLAMTSAILLLFGSTPAAGILGKDPDALARSTRIVDPEVRAAFYRTGGRLLLGKKVHLHVEAKVFRRDPEVRSTSRPGDLLVYPNRSVPLIVSTANRWWVQVRRHHNDAREFCIRGRLGVPSFDERRRVHLSVDSIKRAPGTWRYRKDE